MLLFLSPDQDQFLEGRVFGEVSSVVTAHLDDGRLTASIHTSDESYHVEVKETPIASAAVQIKQIAVAAACIQHQIAVTAVNSR